MVLLFSNLSILSLESNQFLFFLNFTFISVEVPARYYLEVRRSNISVIDIGKRKIDEERFYLVFLTFVHIQ